ncbi:hypothetical protein AB6905_16210 [Carnobacterium maltaromaticum]|uniref:hypothetical protein n=1 Tax=Carnobacterium maltaromaticum TaxID=2751 RepID=UPI0039BE7610
MAYLIENRKRIEIFRKKNAEQKIKESNQKKFSELLDMLNNDLYDAPVIYEEYIELYEGDNYE